MMYTNFRIHHINRLSFSFLRFSKFLSDSRIKSTLKSSRESRITSTSTQRLHLQDARNPEGTLKIVNFLLPGVT